MSVYRDEYDPRPDTEDDRAWMLADCNEQVAAGRAFRDQIEGQKHPGCPACNYTALIPATRFGYSRADDRQGSLPCTCTGWRTT